MIERLVSLSELSGSRLRRFGRRGSRVLAVLSLVLWLAACVAEPFTGRSGLQVVPESQMNQMGEQAYEQILADARVMTGTPEAEMLERVGRRIARVVDARMQSDGREPFEWEFTLIEDDQINAFALPGGKVAFYAGIMDVARDEEGVAVVMGHEIAHAWAGHGNKRVSERIVAGVSLEAVRLALSGGENADPELAQWTMAALGVGVQLGAMAFSRGDEAAADEIGLMLMAEAGYDPQASVDFWRRMDEASPGGQPPEFLSTHPSYESRIENLREWMPKALDVYRGSVR